MATTKQLEKLQHALLDAFRNKPSLEQMLFYELNKHLDEIAGGTNLQEIVFHLIQKADSEGWLLDLVRVARESNSGNPLLKVIAEELLPNHDLEEPEAAKVVYTEPNIVQPSQTDNDLKGMTKTIVELDLIGYGELVKTLEEHLSVEIVPHLNKQIQGFVDDGLTKVGKTRERVVIASNGDNAVIVFDDANHAHKFAEAVHQATQEHNSKKTEPSAQRWFRIGAATGKVVPEDNSKLTGYVIVIAYRLEANAKPGEFLVDLDTYNAFAPELQQKYGLEETLSGKHNESFSARRCKMIDFALTTTATEATVIEVLELFEQLKPRDQILRVMTLIEMPQEYRPPDTLTISQRQDKVLDWVANDKGKLKKLKEKLLYLINKQHSYSPTPTFVDTKYSNLEELLKARNWGEADNVTFTIIRTILDLDKKQPLYIRDIKTFPCPNLLTIEQLWLKYSNARFCFSKQQQIWDNLLSTQTKQQQEEDYAWKTFLNQVSWNGQFISAQNAPDGHFPAIGTWFTAYQPGWLETLFSRLDACNPKK